MIKDVPLIGIFVNDQERALEFYADKLGLLKVQDEPYDGAGRWITVSPPGMEIEIALRKHALPFQFSDAAKAQAAPVVELDVADQAQLDSLAERVSR